MKEAGGLLKHTKLFWNLFAFSWEGFWILKNIDRSWSIGPREMGICCLVLLPLLLLLYIQYIQQAHSFVYVGEDEGGLLSLNLSASPIFLGANQVNNVIGEKNENDFQENEKRRRAPLSTHSSTSRECICCREGAINKLWL